MTGRPDPPAWVADAIFYQVFPDRFASSPTLPKPGRLEPWASPPSLTGFKGGDLIGLAERLDELADLGINAIYLNPIFAAASNHRYNAYDYLQVDPLLGGDAALRRLLDDAHARDMRVILDGVFNHCGRGFWAFHHVLEVGASSPYRDWFYLDDAVLHERRLPNGYPGRGERTVELDEDDGEWYGYTGWWNIPALPKFRVEHPGVREYLFGVAEHWLRFGIDGWRLDVPAEIKDPTFWPEFRQRCRAVAPDAYLVGEIWHEAPDWLRGDRFDGLINYPLGTSILSFVGGEAIERRRVVCQAEYAAMVRPLDGAAFGRRLGRLVGRVEPAIVGAQLNLIGSHDTPRARSVLGGDPARLRLAFLLLLTLPGAPTIYYGDELGLEGGCDPDCRAAYPDAPTRDQADLRATIRALARARHGHVALRRGSVDVVAASPRAIVIAREADGRRALVAVNAGTEPVALAVPASIAARDLDAVELPGLPAGRLSSADDGDGRVVDLPPFGALVLA